MIWNPVSCHSCHNEKMSAKNSFDSVVTKTKLLINYIEENQEIER